jgi:hypothetical protein
MSNRTPRLAVANEELNRGSQMDIANFELWGLGIATAILLIALAYGGWRAGWLSRPERERTDAATVEAQRREVEPGQGGRQGGWWQGSHTRPDDITRGV